MGGDGLVVIINFRRMVDWVWLSLVGFGGSVNNRRKVTDIKLYE